MAVVMQSNTSTAAATTTANVLSGQLYERAPFNGIMRIYSTAEAAGESRVTVYAGSRVVMQEAPLSRQARPPVIPDDFLVSAPVRAGEQLVLQHRNTGAGANTLFWRVELSRR